MKDKKILVVEDDLNLGLLLLDFLQSEGYLVKLCKDGLSGLKAIDRTHYDLCVIDVMMPGMDGFSMAKKIRERGIESPFIFLTAKSMKEDCLKGYALGAEDYINKPFDEDELLCKIRVILRREDSSDFADAPHQFHIGQFTFRYDRLELDCPKKSRRLTEKENEILRLLCIHKNRVLRREDAVQYIYGRKDYFLGRSFDVYISRLRKLLKEDPSLEIQNVFKVGFMLVDKQEQVLQS